MNTKLTNEQWVLRATLVHGNAYDYSLSKYNGRDTKLPIKCNSCLNIFWQAPYVHLKGHGCSICNKIKKQLRPKESFEQEAKIIHNDAYVYFLDSFTNMTTKIKMRHKICDTIFYQSPSDHLQGHGCSFCARQNSIKHIKRTKQDFEQEASSRYNNEYDYIGQFINMTTNMDILHKICGTIFSQSPARHLRKRGHGGCPLCMFEHIAKSKRFTQEEFEQISKKIHGNKFDYSCAKFIDSKIKVPIKCNACLRTFLQTPTSHMHGTGCPYCRVYVSKSETKWLDYVGVPNAKQHRQVPLYINGKTIKVDGFDIITNTVYEFYGDYWHGNLKKYAPDFINTRTTGKQTALELYNKTIARENILKWAGYNLITIWESDWKIIQVNNV